MRQSFYKSSDAGSSNGFTSAVLGGNLSFSLKPLKAIAKSKDKDGSSPTIKKLQSLAANNYRQDSTGDEKVFKPNRNSSKAKHRMNSSLGKNAWAEIYLPLNKHHQTEQKKGKVPSQEIVSPKKGEMNGSRTKFWDASQPSEQ